MKDEVDFLPADIRQMFPQNDTIILGVWPGMPKLPKISLLFLCNILRKKWVMKASIFGLQTSRKAFYKIDTMILMGIVKHLQSSQNSKFTMSLRYLKKEVRDEVDFLHVDKHQSFLQLDFNTLGIKDTYKVILSLLLGMIKHCQSTQSNRFPNIFTISQKKKIGRESIFCMRLNIKVCTSWDYCFWWKWPDFIGAQPSLLLFPCTSRLYKCFVWTL